VNKLLGLPENFIFSLPTTVLYLPSTLVKLNSANQATKVSFQPVKWENSQDMLVNTNLIKEQRVGSKSAQVIRIVHNYSTNTTKTVYFNPVIYLPLRSTDINSVHVWLTDANNILNPSLFPTSLLTLFRIKTI